MIIPINNITVDTSQNEKYYMTIQITPQNSNMNMNC